MNTVKTISANFGGETVTFKSSVLPFAEEGRKCRKVSAARCKPALNAPGRVKRLSREEAIAFFNKINM